MNSVKCPQCGLTNFADAEACKRCRAALDAAGDWLAVEADNTVVGEEQVEGRCSFCGHATNAPFCPRCRARVAPAASKASYGASPRGGSSGLRFLWRVGLLAALVAAGWGVYSYRYRIWYGPAASYALLIRESEQFRKPLSVSVSKGSQRVPMLSAPGIPVAFADASSPAALVLEERGLVSFGVTTTEETKQVTLLSPPTNFSLSPDGTVKAAPAPTPLSVAEKVEYVSVALTPEGQKEAASWTESDSSYWRVPIGEREVVRVDKVGEVKSEFGVERLDVEFTWRWLPNSLGEAFDTDGSVVATLLDRARDAARALNWGSAKVYRAVAHIERRAGGEWRVADIRPSENSVRNKELSAF